MQSRRRSWSFVRTPMAGADLEIARRSLRDHGVDSEQVRPDSQRSCRRRPGSRPPLVVRALPARGSWPRAWSRRIATRLAQLRRSHWSISTPAPAMCCRGVRPICGHRCSRSVTCQVYSGRWHAGMVRLPNHAANRGKSVAIRHARLLVSAKVLKLARSHVGASDDIPLVQ